MKNTKTILIFCVISMWPSFLFGQTPSTKEFWNAVQLNYNLDQIPTQLKARLFQIAIQETNSQTLALEKLETMSKNAKFQDAIFLWIYTHNHNSKEWLRFNLGKLCGSYSMGNPIGDYVFAKYSNDQRALKIIAELAKENELEDEAKEKEQKKKAEKEDIERDRYHYVEQMPEFIEKQDNFFKANMHYPKEALENKIEGRVIANFIVNPDGSVSDITIQRGIGSGCDEEATRLVNAMSGKWTPGKQNGIAVKVYMTSCISFILQKE